MLRLRARRVKSWESEEGVVGTAAVWNEKTSQVGMSNRLLSSSESSSTTRNDVFVAESISVATLFSE